MPRKSKWTEQDSEYLIYLVTTTKLTHAEIANEMDKSTATISLYKKKLGLFSKSGRVSKYSDTELLDILKAAGYYTRDEWDRNNFPVKSGVYETRFGSWKEANELAGTAKYIFTDEELLTILRTAENTASNTWRAGPYIPSVTEYRKRFGSWSNALYLAGVVSSGGTKAANTTILYLIRFLKEDIYKIGITQRSIKDRLIGYPEYEVLLDISFEEYKDAKSMETSWLRNVLPYKIDNNILEEHGLSGFTECFKYV